MQAQRDILERDQSRFYSLMPMFLPQAPDGLNYDDLLWAMTRDQGYEAHCGQLEWWLDKDLWGQVGKFFESQTPPLESFYNNPFGRKELDPVIFHNTDPYIVDFTRARIPMMRGLESRLDTQKNSSLEGMFGANQQGVEKAYSLNASGVAKNLLSSYQQCLAKSQNIVAAATICDEITNEECTLVKEASFNIAIQEDGSSRKLQGGDTRLLPGEIMEKVSFKMTALRGWFEEIRPNLHGNELYEQVCYDITGGDATTTDPNYTPPPVDKVKLAKLSQAIDAVPIDLDTLYRLAFLILSPRQNKGEGEPPDVEGDKFFWLQADPPAQINSWAHAPIFIAFKIPDFGTNKSRAAGNIDTLELAKRAIQTKEQNDKDLMDQTKKREAIYEAAKAAELIELESEKIINCPAAYPQCLKTLNMVMVNMVNGARLKCHNDTLRVIRSTTDENGEPLDLDLNLSLTEKQEVASGIELIFNQEDLNWERAGDLFTPANKDIKENTYVGPPNTEVAATLGSSKSNPYEWELVIDSDPPDLEAPMIVNAYLILPIGETIKDANKAMAIFWDEAAFFEMIQNNVIEDMKNEDNGKSKMGAIPKHYTITDAVLGFSGIDSINPLDERVCEQRIGVNGPYQHCSYKRYQFGVGFSETKGEMLIPDFGLGFMVRKIQQLLRSTAHSTYNYILSCQRVEDMFLGRCKGNPEGELENQAFCSGEAFKKISGLPPASTIPSFAQNIFTADIAPRLTPELIEAYEYAEEQTGIPCEVVAGIHWTEAGLNPNGSVFSGSEFSGSLKDNAAEAMRHLISIWPGSFDRNNIPYEELVGAISNYNGPGNLNCSYSEALNSPRPTRWRTGGQCDAEFFGEDHPHAVAWIDQRHSNMDLIYCMDFIEWSCQTEGTEVEQQQSADYIREWMNTVDPGVRWSEERIQAHVQEAAEKCFASSSICQTLSDGSKYPRYERPGSVTTAILIHESGSAAP